MTGIILTGHGRFAEGMYSAVKLIAGEQECFICVNFEHEPEQLENDMKAAIERLSDCERVIVFCDLAGGSPFKTAGMLSAERADMDVIAGVNLPMLCETVLMRQYVSEADSLASNAVKTGKEQVILLGDIVLDEEEDPKEGI
ncbi:MAG: PTS sugar transporter subunit IIA [Solobacterium sp.]|nr:PTS sugar transporter subunit IIA [Solobacterium sp.]